MSDEFPYPLTAHAAKVIAERQRPLEWVMRVLRRPAKVETDGQDPTLRHALSPIPEYGGRVLRVVYDEGSEPWSVITAYFDRRQKGKL